MQLDSAEYASYSEELEQALQEELVNVKARAKQLEARLGSDGRCMECEGLQGQLVTALQASREAVRVSQQLEDAMQKSAPRSVHSVLLLPDGADSQTAKPATAHVQLGACEASVLCTRGMRPQPVAADYVGVLSSQVTLIQDACGATLPQGTLVVSLGRSPREAEDQAIREALADTTGGIQHRAFAVSRRGVADCLRADAPVAPPGSRSPQLQDLLPALRSIDIANSARSLASVASASTSVPDRAHCVHVLSSGRGALAVVHCILVQVDGQGPAAAQLMQCIHSGTPVETSAVSPGAWGMSLLERLACRAPAVLLLVGVTPVDTSVRGSDGKHIARSMRLLRQAAPRPLDTAACLLREATEAAAVSAMAAALQLAQDQEIAAIDAQQAMLVKHAALKENLAAAQASQAQYATLQRRLAKANASLRRSEAALAAEKDRARTVALAASSTGGKQRSPKRGQAASAVALGTPNSASHDGKLTRRKAYDSSPDSTASTRRRRERTAGFEPRGARGSQPTMPPCSPLSLTPMADLAKKQQKAAARRAAVLEERKRNAAAARLRNPVARVAHKVQAAWHAHPRPPQSPATKSSAASPAAAVHSKLAAWEDGEAIDVIVRPPSPSEVGKLEQGAQHINVPSVFR